MKNLLQIAIDGRLATITLNDPSRRNAMSSDLFTLLEEAIDSVDSSDAVALRFRAEGPAFCAGFDLAECVDAPDRLGMFVQRLGGIVARLQRMPVVTIAEVNGPALAGGCALVSGCDLVHASRAARFGYPVHRIGISPAVSLPTLMQSIGSGSARALTLSGDIIDADAACAMGLVHHVHEDADTMDSSVRALCDRLIGHPLDLLALTKQAFDTLDASTADPILAMATEASVKTTQDPEASHMLGAFWSKRKPS